MNQDTTTETIMANAITERVRERYAGAARSVQDGGGACCSTRGAEDVVTGNLYDATETESLPR